jgi:putative tryptophan/tyrosine transport system substrate-binding protein
VRRREFIGLLGGAATWPLAARAQQAALPVIGYLGSGSRGSDDFRLLPFQQGLGEAGFVEGRNVAIEYRWAEGKYERLPALAADLVRRQVSLLVAGSGTTGALAAKAATTTIPTLFMIGGDPVKLGLVDSFNRPGGNVTGVSVLNSLLGAKQCEFLHELAPNAAAIGFLVNPTTPLAASDSSAVEAAARALGQQVLVAQASTASEIDAAFASLVQRQAKALLVDGDPFFNSRPQQLVALAARHALPTMYQDREFVRAGGLMSYGPSIVDAWRQVGVYASRILRGTKPTDLPVVQSTKFPLVLNLTTAKTLGLEVPPMLLAIATEVIESN